MDVKISLDCSGLFYSSLKMSSKTKKFELSPRLKLGVGRGYSQNQILKFSAIICLSLAALLAVNAVRLVIRSNNPAAPQVLGASDTQTETKTVEFTSYTVQKGDTLFNISQKFNIEWGTLAVLNNLKSPFVLKPGQSINIPK